MGKHWTPEEDEKLKAVYRSGTKKSILDNICKPWLTIRRRAHILNLRRDSDVVNEDKKIRGVRKDSWTTEEESILMSIYVRGSKEEILSKIDRTWQSIWSRAYAMGLHRDEDVVHEEMRESVKEALKTAERAWTKEEDSLLIITYPTTRRIDLLKKFDRTWRSLRTRACFLKVRRDSDLVKIENVEYRKKASSAQ